MVALMSALLPAPGESYAVTVALLAGINMVLAVSLNIVNGFTGQFSLGHAGFMALGAYLSALVTKSMAPYQLAGLPAALGDQLAYLVAMLAGGVFAGAVGFVVGLPSLRLRGDYLAIVTLGFNEIIRVLIENTETVGGAAGYSNIPPRVGFGWVFAIVLITVMLARRLHESTHGRAFLAVREDEIAAEAMGVHTTRYKVMAFVSSSFLAGVAGALFAHSQAYLNPKSFTYLKSTEVVVMVVLGGMGSISGAIIAAGVLTLLPEGLRGVQGILVDAFGRLDVQSYPPAVRSVMEPLVYVLSQDLRMVIYSSLLIAIMLLRPTGLFGKREIWEVLAQWQARRTLANRA
jgi:branched-chain amino acid transport system permease protein